MGGISCKINYKAINNMIADLQKLETTEVSSGFDDTPHSGTVTNADVANFQENGVRNKGGGWHTEPRKFMTMAKSILVDSVDKEVAAVVVGTLQHNSAKVNKNLELIGEEGRLAIQAAMDTQQFKALSPTTLRIKRAKNARYVEDILFESGKLYEGVFVEIK